jgi:hypothetical protein
VCVLVRASGIQQYQYITLHLDRIVLTDGLVLLSVFNGDPTTKEIAWPKTARFPASADDHWRTHIIVSASIDSPRYMTNNRLVHPHQ